MADRKGPVIFGIPGTADGGAAVSVSRMGHITEADKDAALEIAIRGLLGDARRSRAVDYPGAGAGGREAAAPGPRGNGWRDPGPLLPPPGVAIIDAMVNAMQPHGAPAALARGPGATEPEPAPEAAPISAAPKAEVVTAIPLAAQAAEPKAAGVTRRRLA